MEETEKRSGFTPEFYANAIASKVTDEHAREVVNAAIEEAKSSTSKLNEKSDDGLKRYFDDILERYLKIVIDDINIWLNGQSRDEDPAIDVVDLANQLKKDIRDESLSNPEVAQLLKDGFTSQATVFINNQLMLRAYNDQK